MLRMLMDALFTIVGRTMPIVALTLLSACVNTNVNVTCPPGAGPEDGPGISCTADSSKTNLLAGTLVSSINNVVTIPANQTIPTGVVCRVDATHVSTQCRSGIPGQACGFTPGKKCRDTYNMVTTDPNYQMCECRCNP
jgi:hypothetical protein